MEDVMGGLGGLAGGNGIPRCDAAERHQLRGRSKVRDKGSFRAGSASGCVPLLFYIVTNEQTKTTNTNHINMEQGRRISKKSFKIYPQLS